MHDELEQTQEDSKKLQQKTVREVMEVCKANEKMLMDNQQWRKDIDAIAMVTSCMAEYLAMQTAIDQDAYQHRLNMMSSKVRESLPLINGVITSRIESDADTVAPLKPVQIENKDLAEADSQKLFAKERADRISTAELLNSRGHSTTKKSKKSSVVAPTTKINEPVIGPIKH